MKVFYTSLIALLVCLFFVASSQVTPATGKVVNEANKPVQGATVFLKRTKALTSTDEFGSFKIAALKPGDTLVFQAAGYALHQHIANRISITKPIRITIHADYAALSEVVVTGYGTEKRRDFASSSMFSGRVSSMSKRAPGLELKSASIYVRQKLSAQSKNEVSRPGLLTAGELSDFKKWKLWSDYTELEFKTSSEHWGIVTKNRYCAQVQNEDHKPVVAEKVYLVNDNTKDTVWYAETDNTGKAELWANLNNKETQHTNYSIICKDKVLTSPAVFENGVNRIRLKQPCNVSNMVDIAFVVDATGSMGDEIHYLQQELQDIITTTAGKYTSIKVRTGAVFYRDRGDQYLTRYNDFQADPANLVSFLKKQSAAGGGDTPEAVEDGLTTALDSLHWNAYAYAKILFLVLDAPPHDAAKTRMNELMRQAAKQGIRIVPVVCSGIDKLAEYLMRCIALATNGSYVFLTDDSGIGNPHIKPTTDEFKVELLNDLLKRLISEMIYVPSCNDNKRAEPVSEFEGKDIKVSVYPNPTQGNITIKYSEQIKEVFITDFTGKVLMKVDVSTKVAKTLVNLGQYPSGTYLVKSYTKDRGWATEKVVLTH